MRFLKPTYYKFVYALAALAVTTGCSEEAPAGADVLGGADGELTLSLKFNAETRATTETGTDAESQVQSVSVYLFDGTTEEAYCYGRVPGTIIKESTPADSQVERTVKVQATNAQIAKTQGIVVVVNEPTTPYFDGVYSDNMKFKYIFGRNKVQYLADVAGVATDGKFVMTTSNYVGTDGKETYITPVTAANWTAIGSGATTTPVPVYVERIAAKVDFTWGNPTVTADADVQFVGWGLNVLNRAYYAVKYLQAGFLDTYQSLVDGTNRWPGINQRSLWNNATGHRSYWAVDPNYTNNAPLYYPSISSFGNASGTSLYCLENTMNYDHQRRDETTCAIIVAKYLPKGLDFSADTDKETWYIWNNHYYTTTQLMQAVVDAFSLDYGITADDLELVTGSELKIQGTLVGYTSYKVHAKDGASLTGITVDELNAMLDAMFDGNPISCYLQGYCYYEIPIKQFGDDVPWNATTTPNQKWHLGRYGVVRNHMYKLSVKSVNNPGTPFTTETIKNSETDDIATYRLDVSVSVLKWTVRTQFVDL